MVNISRRKKLGKRLVAYLIDWYLGSLLTTFLIASFALKKLGKMGITSLLIFDTKTALLLGTFSLMLAFFYYVIIPYKIFPNQTLGKKIMGLQIVREDGNNMTFSTLIIRQVVAIIIIEGSILTAGTIFWQMLLILTGSNLVKLFSVSGLAISSISALMLLFTKKSKALHDYLANTLVITKPK